MSGVQSVERAFAILGCLAGGPAKLSDVAERVDLPKSTVSRLLSTLQVVGAVEPAGRASGYRIGARMIEIASGALPGRHLITVARPHLAELVQAVGEAAGLAVLDDRDALYLDQVHADNAVLVRDWTGSRFPAHCTSSGLVMLANASETDRERYLAGPLVGLTEHSMTDPVALRRRLLVAADDGYVWAHDEGIDGISSVAAPLVGPGGHVVAAIHAHGPSYRFPSPDDTDGIAARVVRAAGRISATLADLPGSAGVRLSA